MIDCEIELDLSCSKDYTMSEEILQIELLNSWTQKHLQWMGTIQWMQHKQLVVSLTINDNINFLENMKQGVKWTIYRNRYRSEITTQPKYNKLDDMIDPTLRNINRLFVLSFKNCDSDPTKILLISITCH